MMGNSIDNLILEIYQGPKSRPYHSVFTCCLGNNQSGKTDFALYQLERIHALGLGEGYGSNIPDLKASFDIDFIEDYDTLERRCQMLNPNPKNKGLKRYFFVADEMGDWAPKDQPWQNVEFIKKLQKVRKIGLNLIGCGIDRIDGRILNEKHFHGYFVKVSKSNPRIAKYYDWTRRRVVTIKNIPRTTIEFDTFNSASFYMHPRDPEIQDIPLNREHKMVLEYLETGSWDKTEYSRKEGQRAIIKVLRFYKDNFLHSVKDMPEVSE